MERSYLNEGWSYGDQERFLDIRRGLAMLALRNFSLRSIPEIFKQK
jgi:hypothetical protein